MGKHLNAFFWIFWIPHIILEIYQNLVENQDTQNLKIEFSTGLDFHVFGENIIYKSIVSNLKNNSKIFKYTYLKKKFPLLSKSESVKFSLIESVIWIFTDSSVKKYFSLLNQLIFTDSPVEKIFFTVKSVDFHWNNQWNLTDLQ